MKKSYEKILFSKTRVDCYETPTEADFNSCLSDLLAHGDIMRLDSFQQHLRTSRLSHCVNVAYYSYLISRRFGFDTYSAARAGLLHDFYLYDWRTEKKEEAHAFAHPKEALRNARAITDISLIEENAILAHMWPLAKHRPRYGEAVAVWLADNFCCVAEVLAAVAKNIMGMIIKKRAAG